MGKDQNIKVVQIFVYQELKDSLCERNLIYCDILEPENKTLSIPESSKEHDEIVNGIFQRVFDAILTVVELQDIGLMEWYSTSILEHNTWKGYKYVLITIQCRSETYNSVDSLQKALHAFYPVRFIDLDEVGHLMEGLKSHMDEVVENMSDAGNYSAKRITPIPMPGDIYMFLQVKRERWFVKPGVLNLLKWKIWDSSHPIPSKEELDRVLPVKSNMDKIKHPPVDKIQVTWIGHATMLVQMEDMTILTDPVLDSFCGPIWPFGYKRHRNASCQVKDIEKLDAVIISHNHYDHLEAKAVREINAKFKDVHWFVAGGTKAWFLAMDVEDKNLTELDWWHGVEFNGVKFICTPSQHWCQRSIFDFNTCLWCSWVVKGPRHSFYFAGDTGYYEDLFKKIGETYGPFDLAGIPIGAYTPRFITKYRHVNPEEAVKIHVDIRSKMSIGIEWGTFHLTNEHYLEPPHRLKKAMEDRVLNPSNFVCLNIGETWDVGGPREEPQFMKEKGFRCRSPLAPNGANFF